MKKIALALITTLVINENMIANEYQVMSNGMSLGVQKIDMGGDADNVISYELGYYQILGDEMIKYGFEWNIGYTNDDSSASSEFIGDISGIVGYTIQPNLDIYGTVGYGMQTFGIITSATGLVYGLSLRYGMNDDFGIALSYKKYNLDYEYFDINYDSSAMGMKLDFAF